MATPSIFEAAGGEPGFLRLAEAHHARCLADPVLNHPFSHQLHPDHVARLGSYWAEVFGGPPRFSEECVGHSAMLVMHAGCEAEVELGKRFVDCFVGAADDARLPSDPELRDSLRGYMEWAVAQVMAVSPRGSTVQPDLAMPHWTWDGLQS